MKRWLREELRDWFSGDLDRSIVRDLWRWLGLPAGIDIWDVDCDRAARAVVKRIQWPRTKPPAHVTIDDRAYQFMGRWEYDLDGLAAFKPWNR